MKQSILNEYGVIGSLLIDSALFPEASGLSEDDFTLAPLREVFRAMRRQFAENGSFDALTVRAEAGQHCPEVTDKLLLESMEITPTTANLTVYVSAVKEASLSRKLAVLGNELVSSGRTPAEALSHARTVIQELAEDGGAGEASTVADALNALCARVERQADGKAPCVPSGLAGLDKLLGGGYINGGLHIVGARPSVGKSALALQIALNAAKSGVKVVSLEMSSEDCSARLVGNLGGGSAARFMFGGSYLRRNTAGLQAGCLSFPSCPSCSTAVPA